MKKLIHRYKRWLEWKKFSNYSRFKKILVFLGIKKSAWFDSFVDWRNENNK